jgi:phosphoglycolate phosphatase-like HAD superfamily hydrolase
MSPFDVVLLDIGGTLVVEAPPGTATAELEVVLRPHVLDDLRALAVDHRLGAVTNTAVMREADIRALLAPSGVDALLEVVVTSVDVGAWKPDPRPIVEALRRLGVEPSARVLYVGDQPTDEAAALAAGVRYADVGRRLRASVVAAAARSWETDAAQ